VFSLTAQAIETGYELRTVVRELARLTRDLLVVKIDASRALDPEIAADAERERITALAARFSQEDLMRAFEVLTKAEYEIKGSAHPRYHLEMALLRWIHMQKLVPLSDLILDLDKGGRPGVNSKLQTPNSKPQTPNAQGPTPNSQPTRANSQFPTPNSQSPTSNSQLPPLAKPAPRPVAASSAAVKAVEARRESAKPGGGWGVDADCGCDDSGPSRSACRAEACIPRGAS
jgi:DNA polymerase-3 subunit gamma/tau